LNLDIIPSQLRLIQNSFLDIYLNTPHSLIKSLKQLSLPGSRH
jgi:hypothetical protein